MSIHSSLRTTGTKAAPMTHVAHPGLVLQRKCACGASAASSLAGECVQCKKKRLFGMQAKLRISTPGDVYEQEADHIADVVMNMGDRGARRAPGSGESAPSADTHEGRTSLARKTASSNSPPVGEEAEELERAADGDLQEVQAFAPTDGVAQSIASLHGGEPLPRPVRRFFEPRFGFDFGRVRLHHDRNADEMATAIGARAFTLGRHIVLRSSEYAPGTRRSLKLLAHELAHVVQQEPDGHGRRNGPLAIGRLPAGQVRLQRCSADGQPPTVSNTVVCDGKDSFKVRVTSFGGAQGEKCGLKSCMIMHEAHHIADYGAWCPDICKGQPDGSRTLMTADERKNSEVPASNIEIACLQGWLATHTANKDAACTTMVQNRITQMEAYRDSFK